MVIGVPQIFWWNENMGHARHAPFWDKSLWDETSTATTDILGMLDDYHVWILILLDSGLHLWIELSDYSVCLITSVFGAQSVSSQLSQDTVAVKSICPICA